jgi:hypothetical protein
MIRFDVRQHYPIRPRAKGMTTTLQCNSTPNSRKDFDMALTGTKSIFSSLTLAGILTMLLPHILALFGIDLGADSAGVITNLVEGFLTFFGAILAIYGRLRATKRLVPPDI